MSLIIEIPTDRPGSGEAERRAETRRRRRMLDGDWREEAEDRLADFFADEVREFLPAAELSRNPAASYTAQLAILYDEPYTVDIIPAPGAEPQSTDVSGELLAIQQDLLRYVVGCNDAALRLDPEMSEEGPEIDYRVVTLDLLYVETDPMDVCRLLFVEEDRPRVHPDTQKVVWTKERWDVRDPEAPKFTIVTFDAQGREEDLTTAYMGADGWPPAYVTRDGAPIVPYVLYHRYVSHRWATPYRGSELFDGTLTVAALWTMWVAGVRDGSFPARVVVDGNIRGGTVDRGTSGASTQSHVINPLAVLQIDSKGDARTASFGQWQPTADPKANGEAVEQFEAGLAVHAGLSTSDVTRGSSGQSGYSIVVSRDGQRRQMAKLRVPLAQADAERCATAAKLLNAAGNGSELLPESSSAYRIQYAGLPQAPEEVKADLDRIKALRDAKLMTRVQAYMEVHPGADESAARTALAEIDAESAAAAPPQPPPFPPPSAGPTDPQSPQ